MRLPPVQHVLDGLIVTKFEEKVRVHVVTEVVVAADNVLVDEPTMDSGFSFRLNNQCC